MRWIEKNKIISFVLALGISFLLIGAILKHQRAKHLESLMLQSQLLQQTSNSNSRSPSQDPSALNIVSDKTSPAGTREVSLSQKTKAQLEKEKREAQIASTQVKRKIMEVGQKVQREIASAQRYTFKIHEFENRIQDIESSYPTSAGRLNAYADLRNQIFLSRTTPIAQKRQMLESLDRKIASAPLETAPGLDFKYEKDGSVLMTPKGH